MQEETGAKRANVTRHLSRHMWHRYQLEGKEE